MANLGAPDALACRPGFAMIDEGSFGGKRKR